MKHYRLNQIAMAVLGALLLFFGTKTLINIAFEEHEPEKPGLEVAGTEEPKEEEKPGDTPDAAGSEVLALLATADAAQGEADGALCKVCHTFDAGGASMIGPNLHNVVGRKIASLEGFNYSPALKAKEGDWTYEQIDAFITNPQVFAPGTIMAFPGVPDVKKRANIIAFLRSQTDNPPPLPEAAAAPAEEAPETPEATEPEPAAPAEEEPAEPEPPAAAPEEPAPTEEAPAPAAEPEAPAEPEPPAAAASEEEPKPAEEPAPAETEPSAGEAPNPSWPQPVYPGEPAEPAEGHASSASEASSDSSEDSHPSWPQPVYPDGAPN